MADAREALVQVGLHRLTQRWAVVSIRGFSEPDRIPPPPRERDAPKTWRVEPPRTLDVARRKYPGVKQTGQS
jgi:hypothetical protein